MARQEIKVGEPYPSALPQERREGLWPRLVMGGVHLIFITPKLQDGDLETLRRQKMQLGVKIEESVPFFSVYLKRWGCIDGHLNPHQYEDDSVWDYIEGFGNLWSLIVAEGQGRKRIVRLNRVLGVEMAIAELVQKGMAQALEDHEDGADVERSARRVYDRYKTPQDLAEVCTEKQVFQSKM